MKAFMTPEEHYAYGEDILRGCEQMMEVDPSAANAQASIAMAHFNAAAAGAGMRALGVMTETPVMVERDDPECGQVPCDHAPDGGNHPAAATDG